MLVTKPLSAVIFLLPSLAISTPCNIFEIDVPKVIAPGQLFDFRWRISNDDADLWLRRRDLDGSSPLAFERVHSFGSTLAIPQGTHGGANGLLIGSSALCTETANNIIPITIQHCQFEVPWLVPKNLQVHHPSSLIVTVYESGSTATVSGEQHPIHPWNTVAYGRVTVKLLQHPEEVLRSNTNHFNVPPYPGLKLEKTSTIPSAFDQLDETHIATLSLSELVPSEDGKALVHPLHSYLTLPVHAINNTILSKTTLLDEVFAHPINQSLWPNGISAEWVQLQKVEQKIKADPSAYGFDPVTMENLRPKSVNNTLDRRAAASISLASDATRNTMMVYANFASAAYCSLDPIRRWGLEGGCSSCLMTSYQDFEVLDTFQTGFSNEDDYQGYVGFSHKSRVIVVAFRGTANIQNHLENLIFQPVECYFCADTKVHYGFLSGALLLWKTYGPDVIQMARRTGYNVIFTGHSLGGALATLSAALALDALSNEGIGYGAGNIGIVTFGSPRVGTESFAEWFSNQQWLQSLRGVNYVDLVPSLPPLLSSFRHVRGLHWQDGSGNLVTCNDDAKKEDDNCYWSRLNRGLSNHFSFLNINMGSAGCFSKIPTCT
ncbi:Alpha/Beta hydrolase protein [Chytridium lagenaria]|nr:Alpha/Beta hydrolase protein [Chytridium lagenaria]